MFFYLMFLFYFSLNEKYHFESALCSHKPFTSSCGRENLILGSPRDSWSENAISVSKYTLVMLGIWRWKLCGSCNFRVAYMFLKIDWLPSSFKCLLMLHVCVSDTLQTWFLERILMRRVKIDLPPTVTTWVSSKRKGEQSSSVFLLQIDYLFNSSLSNNSVDMGQINNF